MPSLVVLVALTRVLSCTSLRRRPDGTMLARGKLRGVSEAPRNHIPGPGILRFERL
jgi:hypothetical protein